MTTYSQDKTESDRRVLELLSQNFGNISTAATEIINLEAILNLPKGTEHFIADIHGESEAFRHILKNASGNIKRKVNEIFSTSLREDDIRQLCSLIYYPERKLALIRSTEKDLENFYQITLHQLIKVLQSVSSKYSRSKVRKSLPSEFAYIIEELLHESPSEENKQPYYNRIIESIISTGQAEVFIRAISHVIQHLSIDQLHLLGDIYDRGDGAHLVLDTLLSYRDFDIQWGNHDVLWMGAACGNEACIANVLRISLRYGNMTTLEDGYGINLVPLATFAMEKYGDDPCDIFMPKDNSDEEPLSDKNRRLIAKMHKAIAIIQFKLEGQIIERHPEWNMGERRLLHLIDLKDSTIKLNGKTYPLKDSNLPTLNPSDPYALTEEEKVLMEKLTHSFLVSDKLKSHISIFYSHGSLYAVHNSNLLFHASMPLNEDGTLKDVAVNGKPYHGKELLQQIELLMRSAVNSDTPDQERKNAVDYYLYAWCGPDSPLFDKARMTTFERYFIANKETHQEEKGWYYHLRDNEEICDMILDAFGVFGEHRHIINGHVPVMVGSGENPVKANGKLMVIDGGFSKAYHDTTGIAGYTLVYHSRGFELVQHEPFTSAEEAVKNGTDIISTNRLVELSSHRMRVRDTDRGRELLGQIEELRELLYAYRRGLIKERK
ncbi:MAG: fructose-1,6-bisphosphatase [Muribaculaceae bacterium]